MIINKLILVLVGDKPETNNNKDNKEVGKMTSSINLKTCGNDRFL